MIATLLRHWHAPGRTPRSLRIAVAIICGCGALALTLGAASAQERPDPPSTARAKTAFAPGPGNPTANITSDAPTVLATGRSLFVTHCASCHNLDLRGRGGIAPSLIGVGAGAVNFYVSTGRMPLHSSHDQPLRAPSMFDSAQQRAIVSYVYHAAGGPPAPSVDARKGSLAQGLDVFTLNCAGCHQIVARGGLTIGAHVPNLQQATAQQIAEAVRTGPYLMPRYDARQISQQQLDSLVRYVLWTRAPSNRGGWGIYNLGPIPEGMVAWLLGLAALLLVIRLIGERAPV